MMSADFLQNLISANLTTLVAFAANGEYRVMNLRDAVQTDARGFPDSDYVPQTQAFMPCSWTAKRADEMESGESVRELSIFEITGSVVNESGIRNVIVSGSRLELRTKKGDGFALTLDVISVVNQGNAALRILASEVK